MARGSDCVYLPYSECVTTRDCGWCLALPPRNFSDFCCTIADNLCATASCEGGALELAFSAECEASGRWLDWSLIASTIFAAAAWGLALLLMAWVYYLVFRGVVLFVIACL